MDEQLTKLATFAMATRFELVLDGDDPTRLRAAGEEAIEEIERLDRQLSRFRPDSDITWINTHAAEAPVKAEPGLFELLKRAQEIWQATGGAFDITIAPLMRAWGFTSGHGRVPTSDDLAAAREITGLHHVTLDESDYTISFDNAGVELDLGAIGKGYAIEQAAYILKSNGVTSALIHGGTSTVHLFGNWDLELGIGVAIESSGISKFPFPNSKYPSISVSAPHGRSFTADGRAYGHVIDPRTGQPVSHTKLAAVWGPCPTDCDALSTALLVLGEDWLPTLRERFPGYDGLVRS